MRPRLTSLALVALCLTHLVTGQDRSTTIPEEVTLQLTGVDGKPVPDEKIFILYQAEKQYHFEHAYTDKRGSLELFPPAELRGAKKGTLIIRRAAWPEDGETLPTGYRGLKVLRFAVLGETWKVQLEQPPLLLAGQVFDRQGKPIAGVRVSVGGNVQGHPVDFRALRDRVMYDNAVRTGTDGCFAIHGRDQGRSQVHVQLEADGYVPIGRSKPSVGSKAVKLVMGRSTKVYGKILGVPDKQFVAFDARLIPHDRVPGRAYYSASLGQRGGNIEFKGIPVGTYDFEFHARQHSDGKPLVQTKDIVIEAGVESRDPRLAAIDISAHWTWVQIKVVGSDGEALPSAKLITRQHGGTSTQSVHGKRPTWLMISTAGIEMEVASAGYQSRMIKLVGEDLEVVLTRGWRLELSIPGLPELSAVQVRVSLHKAGKGDSQRRSRRGSSTFDLFADKSQKETMPVGKAGSYVLRLRAEKRPLEGEPKRRMFGGPEAGDHIIRGSHELELSADQAGDEFVPVAIGLTAIEIALLKRFDALLKERK